jgi:hypothetical protein
MNRHKVAFVAVIGSSLIATAAFAQSKSLDQNNEEDLLLECPAPLRGVQLSLESVSGGVAVKFTTDNKTELEDLRALLREAATLIEYHTKLAALHPEDRQTLPQEVVIPAVDVDVKDIKMGAQITIRPDDPSEVNAVRAQAKKLQDAWGESPCMEGGADQVRT